MAMEIIGLKKAGQQLRRDLDQMPFAAALALTRTARQAVDIVRRQAEQDLDKPTPFTLRGFRWERATKRRLFSKVFVAPIQADYLFWQVQGGERKKRASTGEALPVPGNIRLNRYGNIPARHRGRIGQLMARPDTFIGVVRGTLGLWQRGNRSKRGKFTAARRRRPTSLKLLLRFEQSVTYKPLFKFQERNRRSFNERFEPEYDIAFRKALATAR